MIATSARRIRLLSGRLRAGLYWVPFRLYLMLEYPVFAGGDSVLRALYLIALLFELSVRRSSCVIFLQ